MIRFQAKGIACFARTHGRDEADVAKVCDSYDGVVVPYVEDFEETRRLAAAALYRPLKGKRLDRVLATAPAKVRRLDVLDGAGIRSASDHRPILGTVDLG